jgi:hypothetical protein
MFNKKDLIDCFKSQEIDFTFEEGIQGVSWISEGVDIIKSFSVGYSGYPDRYYLQSPFISVTHKKIEFLIKENSQKIQVPYSDEAYTIKLLLSEYKISYDIFKQPIINRETFDNVFKEELRVFNQIAIPFYVQYQDLNKVAELLSSLKPQEVVPYIQGAKLFCKTILILRETKHPKYLEKLNEFYDVLKKQATKKEVYAQQLRLFELLFFTQQS